MSGRSSAMSSADWVASVRKRWNDRKAAEEAKEAALRASSLPAPKPVVVPKKLYPAPWNPARAPVASYARPKAPEGKSEEKPSAPAAMPASRLATLPPTPSGDGESKRESPWSALEQKESAAAAPAPPLADAKDPFEALRGVTIDFSQSSPGQLRSDPAEPPPALTGLAPVPLRRQLRASERLAMSKKGASVSK